MANCIFGFPDRLIPTSVVTPSLSGGSWINSGDVALGNLMLKPLSSVARSTNALATSSTFNVNLGASRDVRVIAILKHNATTAATVRFRAYSDSGMTTLVYDTGALQMFPPFYPPDLLPWGHPQFWDGALSDEERNGYKFSFYTVIPDNISAQYWMVEIVDTANGDGYIELARCCFMAGWQPPVNFDYGAQVGYESQTKVDKSLGGTPYYDKRPALRVATVTLASNTDDEAAGIIMEMQRRLDIDGEMFFVWDADDQCQAQWQRSMLCHMKQLSPISTPYFNNNSATFALEEIL